MNRLSLLLTIGLGLAVTDGAAQTADSVPPTDAYHDATTADHVRLARERRQIADLSVERYRALSKERMSVVLRGIRRDRLLYRREVAGRIDWTRDGPGRIEILGAREAVPVAIKGVQLPSDLDAFMPHLAFDPADNRMLVGWDDNEFVRHPLAAGAERYYRYKTGGTTSIQLPDGRVVRLVELEITSRTRDPKNITGSFWLDAGTHSIVQAAFRLARDVDIMKDIEGEDDEEVPGFLKPMVMTLDYVTIEYGLYDLKWWMPRSMMFEGSVHAGAMFRLPMQYERTYSGYEIEGRDQPLNVPITEVLARDSIRREQQDSCENRKGSITVDVGSKPRKEHTDSAQTSVTQCGRWEIVMPTDTSAMLSSAELPADVFATGEQLVSEGELRELADKIRELGGGPLLLEKPVVDLDLLSLYRSRYNRVEGLSIAGRADTDYGAYRTFAEARIGSADLHPNLELAVQKVGQKNLLSFGAYRRLNGFDPFTNPFSIGSSTSAVLFGRDEADYYRSLGVELKAVPTGSAPRWYAARLFAQRETAAEKNTDFSLRNVVDNGFDFRENRIADEGNEYGGELRLRYSRGLDPEGLRFGTELFNEGALGDFEYARTALTVRLGVPMPGALTGALEGAAGVTSSGAPLQHNWYIGGPNTLRGYHAGALFGETFWRGRAEIGYGLPAVRLVGFSDAGWAGRREDFSVGKPLVSVGGGASFLDGIIRFDVARGLRAPKGWTISLYFDAAI